MVSVEDIHISKIHDSFFIIAKTWKESKDTLIENWAGDWCFICGYTHSPQEALLPLDIPNFQLGLSVEQASQLVLMARRCLLPS